MKQLECKLEGGGEECLFGHLMTEELQGAQDVIEYWF